MHTNFETAAHLANCEIFERFWSIDRLAYDEVVVLDDTDFAAISAAHVNLRAVALARTVRHAGDVLEKIKILQTEVQRDHDGFYLDTLAAIEADLKALKAETQ